MRHGTLSDHLSLPGLPTECAVVKSQTFSSANVPVLAPPFAPVDRIDDEQRCSRGRDRQGYRAEALTFSVAKERSDDALSASRAGAISMTRSSNGPILDETSNNNPENQRREDEPESIVGHGGNSGAAQQATRPSCRTCRGAWFCDIGSA